MQYSDGFYTFGNCIKGKTSSLPNPSLTPPPSPADAVSCLLLCWSGLPQFDPIWLSSSQHLGFHHTLTQTEKKESKRDLLVWSIIKISHIAPANRLSRSSWIFCFTSFEILSHSWIMPIQKIFCHSSKTENSTSLMTWFVCLYLPLPLRASCDVDVSSP